MTLSALEHALLNVVSEYGKNYMWEDMDYELNAVLTQEELDSLDDNDAAKEYGLHDQKLMNLGVVETNVEEHHGGEDQGREYWTVWSFKFKDGSTIYVKFEGWYASYHGSEYECCFIVEAKEKVVTYYGAKS